MTRHLQRARTAICLPRNAAMRLASFVKSVTTLGAIVGKEAKYRLSRPSSRVQEK